MPKKRKLEAKHQRQNKRKSHPKNPPGSSPPAKQRQAHQQQQQAVIPFSPEDRILLIGEGDLSFAASLVRHHGCTNVVATVLEKSREDLLEKYPHAAENIDAILASPTTPSSRKKDSDSNAGDRGDDEEVEEDEDAGPYSDEEDQAGETTDAPKPLHNRSKVIYNVDATRTLPASVTRPKPDRIIFNFPHVGGKSTDVNRQVRHNQSLLVSFFERAALPCLAMGGTIVVTLFEAEPYTLWNVRDLARHAGLQVERSFRLQWSSYPGYHHARTLGVVRSKAGGGEAGGWKGEDRSARSYIFARKEVNGEDSGWPSLAKRKRRRDDDDDD